MIGKKIRTYALVLTLGLGMCAQHGWAEETREEQNIQSEVQEMEGLGLRYTYTEEMKENGIRVGYSIYTAINDLGFLNIRTNDADLYYILVYPEEVFQRTEESERWAADFRKNYPELQFKEENFGDYHYTYLDLTESLDLDSYDEEAQERLETAVALCEELADSVEFMELKSPALTFDSLNLDGEQVTDAIFGEKTITVVNVWATYCNPCINEMPELAAWEKEMPEEAQILYLCSDIFTEDSENIELAGMIADKSGIDRKHVIFNLPGTCRDILMQVTGVPTTFFVDQNGNMLDQVVVGADTARYKKILEQYLEEAANE